MIFSASLILVCDAWQPIRCLEFRQRMMVSNFCHNQANEQTETARIKETELIKEIPDIVHEKPFKLETDRRLKNETDGNIENQLKKIRKRRKNLLI